MPATTNVLLQRHQSAVAANHPSRPSFSLITPIGGRIELYELQRQDLVVAAYVLVEMRSSQERASMVAELWRHTQDVLILIEPGTPAGSAAVRAARSQVCCCMAVLFCSLSKALPESGV